MSVIEIDAVLSNADWTKQTWDLPPGSPAELDQWLIDGDESVEHFIVQPTYLNALPNTPWLQQWADGVASGLTAALWDETKHPRHPRGTDVGGQFAPKNYYYGASMARDEDDNVVGYHAFRMDRNIPGRHNGATVVGPVRETHQEATLDARAAFEAELEADQEAIVRYEQELISHVDELRSMPGQGSRHTRTTVPVEGPDGEILRGTRDALQIQADEAGVALDAYDAWTDERVAELTSKAAGARVAVRTDSLPAILERGEIVNVFDPDHTIGDQRTDRSVGYLEARGELENRLFGDHPVYGYVALDDEDMVRSHAKAFGLTKLTLKDEVRERTTITYSDSMFIDAGAEYSDVIPLPIDKADHRVVASWMNLGGVEVPVAYKSQTRRPEPQMSQPETVRFEQRVRDAERSGIGAHAEPGEMRAIEWNKWLDSQDYNPWNHGDFFEAQIHGHISVHDIERVDFEPGSTPDQSLIDRLNELGIGWTIGGPDAA